MRAAGTITALTNKSGQMVFEQEDIEDAVLDHFGTVFHGQRTPVFPAEPPADQIDLALSDMDQILGQPQAEFEPDHFDQRILNELLARDNNQFNFFHQLGAGILENYLKVTQEERSDESV